MRARRLLALLALGAGAGASMAAAAVPVNLLQNPGFATSLAGWDVTTTATTQVTWSSSDHTGTAGSGSALLQDVAAASFDSSIVLSQCVPVSPGMPFVASFDSLIPPGQPTGGLSLGVVTYLDASCGTTNGFFGGDEAAQTGGWTHTSGYVGTVPAGAHSARVRLNVFKLVAGGTFLAYVDNVRFFAPSCVPSDATVCVADGRFRVTASWRLANGSTGAGHGDALTADTAEFWFFSDTNFELLVKVLDGCGVNSRFWVYAGGLTDVRVDVTVTDTQTGTSHTYTNPLGTPFKLVRDTSTFGGCP